MITNDVTIGLRDNNGLLHFREVRVQYLPNIMFPECIELTTKQVQIKLPYNSIEYIFPKPEKRVKILSKSKITGWLWEQCQVLGHICDGIKKEVNGRNINIGWENRTTHEIVMIEEYYCSYPDCNCPVDATSGLCLRGLETKK